MTKDEKMAAVAQETMELILKYGAQGLTYARLARAAKVSRPWLYEYIGSSKDSLIEFAIDHFGKVFSELDRRSPTHTKEEWLQMMLQSTERLLNDTLKYPWILPFYYRYRGTDGVIGERVRYMEDLYLKTFTRQTLSALKIKESQARFISELMMSMRLGLAYHWQYSKLRTPENKKEIILLVRAALKRMLAPRPAPAK